jgi:hypothetical protein
MAVQNPVPKSRPESPPLGQHATQLPALGREPGIVAFAVVRDGKAYVPTKFILEDGKVMATDPCGPRGIYEPTAYEYLMAAVMDHYRTKGIK